MRRQGIWPRALRGAWRSCLIAVYIHIFQVVWLCGEYNKKRGILFHISESKHYFLL